MKNAHERRMTMELQCDTKYTITDKRGRDHEIRSMMFSPESGGVYDEAWSVEGEIRRILNAADMNLYDTREIDFTDINVLCSISGSTSPYIELIMYFKPEASEKFRHNLYAKCVEAISGKTFTRICEIDHSDIKRVDLQEYFKQIDPSRKYENLIIDCERTLDEICKSGLPRKETLQLIIDHLYDFDSFTSDFEDFYYDSLDKNSEYACNECFKQVLQDTYECIDMLCEVDQALPEGAFIAKLAANRIDYSYIEFNGGVFSVEVPSFTVDDCIALEDWDGKQSDKILVGRSAYIYDLSYSATANVNGKVIDVSKYYSDTVNRELYEEYGIYYREMENAMSRLDSKIRAIANEMCEDYHRQIVIQYISNHVSEYGTGSHRAGTRARAIEIMAYDAQLFKKFMDSDFIHDFASQASELSETIRRHVICIDEDMLKFGYQKEHALINETRDLLGSILYDGVNAQYALAQLIEDEIYGNVERQTLYKMLVKRNYLNRDSYEPKKLQKVVDMLNECATNGIHLLSNGKPYIVVPHADVVVKPKFEYLYTTELSADVD